MNSIDYNQFCAQFGGDASVLYDTGNRYVDPRSGGVLLALCRHTGARCVVEFGVNLGATAARLLENCPAIQRYIGIDVPSGTHLGIPQQDVEVPIHATAGIKARHDPRFELWLRPRGTYDLDAADLDCADLVWIDADHSAPAVAHDTGLARAALRARGGVIAWHDYGNATVEVTQVLDAISDLNIVHVAPTWTCYAFIAGAGLPARAATGLPARAATGLPDRAATGLPDRAATGLPDRAATGLPDRAATGLPDRAATGLPRGAKAAAPASEVRTCD